MQVQVTGHHVVVTAAMRSFIESKAERLEDLLPNVRKVVVVLTVAKYRHQAEIHCHAERVELSAKKTTKDMYASVDQAIAALEQQAGKLKDRLHTSAAHRRTAAKQEKKQVKRGNAKAKEEAPAIKTKVVRAKNPATKPMSLEDAQSALEASGAPFILFRDARSGAAQVLYRREDGHFGLQEA